VVVLVRATRATRKPETVRVVRCGVPLPALDGIAGEIAAPSIRILPLEKLR
jgi:hypothetical protein